MATFAGDFDGVSLFSNETFIRNHSKSNELEFHSSKKNFNPIRIGFVSHGSNLKNSLLSAYMKHRSAWNLRSGVVYIAKKMGNEDSGPQDETVKGYKQSYEREKLSLILFDPETFLKLYAHPKPHATMTMKKAQSLSKEWNVANGSNGMIGQRDDVNYSYPISHYAWKLKPGVEHRSQLDFNLSTWAKTLASNMETNATCVPNDVTLQIKLKSTLFQKVVLNDENNNNNNNDEPCYDGWGLSLPVSHYVELINSQQFKLLLGSLRTYMKTKKDGDLKKKKFRKSKDSPRSPANLVKEGDEDHDATIVLDDDDDDDNETELQIEEKAELEIVEDDEVDYSPSKKPRMDKKPTCHF